MVWAGRDVDRVPGSWIVEGWLKLCRSVAKMRREINTRYYTSRYLQFHFA